MTDAPQGERARPQPGGPEMPPDQVLLQQVQQRQEAALAQLYGRYGALIYTLARRIVGDRQLAEEVMQDTFLRCWDGVERYDPLRGRVASWLMGIARNRAIDLVRGRQHQARLREREPFPPPRSPGEVPMEPSSDDRILLRHAVSVALQELPADQRQPIELAYYGGLTQAEIARLLGEPLGTVKSRIRSGLQRLRGYLQPLVTADDSDGEEEAGHRGD